MKRRILAITVTYQPLIDNLFRQIDILLDSKVDILVVDNGSDNIDHILQRIAGYSYNVSALSLMMNIGIAAAQNRGIKYAIAQDYDYVLLMDQDSLPESNMVAELLCGIEMLPDAAAIGPNFIDSQHRSRARFIRVEGLNIIRMGEDDSKNLVEVDHLIASGSLLPVCHLKSIGVMDESLFIDYVDIEWALRARSRGFRSYGLFSAKMFHVLGDDHICILGRYVSVHSPLRHYYMVRNAILLYKRSYIPMNWKVVDGCKLIMKLSILLFFSKKRMENISAIFRGFLHGILDKSGKYESK